MAKSKKQDSLKPKAVDIHYLKTPNYRTYYIDGLFGGLTIGQKFYFDLFLERQPTPRRLTHQITEENTLGNIIDGEGKAGIVREIECGLVFDLDTATKIRDHLSDKIKELKKIKENR